jgi:hypothetical protein
MSEASQENTLDWTYEVLSSQSATPATTSAPTIVIEARIARRLRADFHSARRARLRAGAMDASSRWTDGPTDQRLASI